DPAIRDPGEIRERLNNVAQSIQAKGATLGLLPLTRNFERCFHPSVENRPRGVSVEMERFGHGRIGQRKLRSERISVRGEEGFSEIASLVVIGGAKSGPRHNAEPPEIGIWIKELMEGIDPPRAVVFKAGITREIAMQIRNSGFTFVENRAIENRRPFHIQHYFREALRCIEEAIGLETRDGGQRVNRISFGNRNDIVRLRINSELALIKILHDEGVT